MKKLMGLAVAVLGLSSCAISDKTKDTVDKYKPAVCTGVDFAHSFFVKNNKDEDRAKIEAGVYTTIKVACDSHAPYEPETLTKMAVEATTQIYNLLK